MKEDSSTHWLVERARQSLRENNPYEAKAWLITAKTLYPKDFGVQVSPFEIDNCIDFCVGGIRFWSLWIFGSIVFSMRHTVLKEMLREFRSQPNCSTSCKFDGWRSSGCIPPEIFENLLRHTPFGTWTQPDATMTPFFYFWYHIHTLIASLATVHTQLSLHSIFLSYLT